MHYVFSHDVCIIPTWNAIADDDDSDLDRDLDDSFIVPDDESDESDRDFDYSAVARDEIDEGSVTTPRTAGYERLRRTIETIRRRVAGPVAAAASSTTRRKKKRKTTRRKKKTVRKSGSGTTSTSTASGGTKKRKTRRRRKKKAGKGKGKGKGKNSKAAREKMEEEKRKKLDRTGSESGPSLSLFGNKFDLDFHGDVGANDDLYSNPYPSASSGGGKKRAVDVLSRAQSSTEGKKSSSSSNKTSLSDAAGPDMLNSILSSQKATLSSPTKSAYGEKMKEVYRKCDSPPSVISRSSSSFSSSSSTKENPTRSLISVRSDLFPSSSVASASSSNNSKDSPASLPSRKEQAVNAAKPKKARESPSTVTTSPPPSSRLFKEQSFNAVRPKEARSSQPRSSTDMRKETTDSVQSGSKTSTTFIKLKESSSTPSPSSSSKDLKRDTAERLGEIAETVKPYLRPYFRDGKISKEAYKRVLGQAVKKLFKEVGTGLAGQRKTVSPHLAAMTVQELVRAVRSS